MIAAANKTLSKASEVSKNQPQSPPAKAANFNRATATQYVQSLGYSVVKDGNAKALAAKAKKAGAPAKPFGILSNLAGSTRPEIALSERVASSHTLQLRLRKMVLLQKMGALLRAKAKEKERKVGRSRRLVRFLRSHCSHRCPLSR